MFDLIAITLIEPQNKPMNIYIKIYDDRKHLWVKYNGAFWSECQLK